MDLSIDDQFVIFNICYDMNIYFEKLLVDYYLDVI